ncbi:hypothetical protein GWK47_025087 [Chionoecetes opilio]|uniref:Uncharacterized protein n=1 Tax=Chionoecetes opilio TaxID=41210 RepID=A0A8J4XKT5_CHIOP|nr:hypothetical protein GWK47_025087 [Chionoecetes opilio]
MKMITRSAAPANAFPPGVRKRASERRSSSSPPTHSTPKEAARSPERELASANEAHDDDDESVPSLVIDMSVRSEDQQEAAQGKDWTTVVNGRAARPKFKLGSLVDHASAYLAITALEDENPTLRMRAADAAIPKCSPGRRHRPDWWFYNEDVREHNHRVNLHRKLYKRQPNPTNLRLLQDVVSRARQVSQRAREAKWLEWCASFNQHTSLGQLWRNVRTISGGPPPRPPPTHTPQPRAERLIVFVHREKAPRPLPPPAHRHFQKQFDKQPLRAVREARGNLYVAAPPP